MAVAVVFPGQGSQSVGMEQELGSLALEQLSITDKVLNRSLTKLVKNGPVEDLNLTVNAQPAIFALNYAYWLSLAAKGVQPSFLAGHSLGELSAYLASGVFNFPTGLKVVQKRAELMHEAALKYPGVMLAVLGLSDAEVKKVCAQFGYEVANFNCPGQVVVALKKSDYNKAVSHFKEAGARKVVQLAVSGAFHSTLMQEAAAAFKGFLESVAFQKPKIPVVSNVTAKAVTSAKEAKDCLAKQITASVLWTDSVTYLKANGVNCIIEAGPGKVLSGLVKRIDSQIKVKHASEWQEDSCLT
jgi:[acyl-carrier-protein] S-malonyltransferase